MLPFYFQVLALLLITTDNGLEEGSFSVLNYSVKLLPSKLKVL